jgi:predicted nucleic acid-binding protein
MPHVPTIEADFVRAAKVLEAMCRSGHHRAVGIPNLLIAAVAEREGLAVLHYDKDFDLIARETKQRVDWVVPAGTVP